MKGFGQGRLSNRDFSPHTQHACGSAQGVSSRVQGCNWENNVNRIDNSNRQHSYRGYVSLKDFEILWLFNKAAEQKCPLLLDQVNSICVEIFVHYSITPFFDNR
jgi:hypothetical protein